MITKDELGNIIDAEELNPETNVESCVSEINQDRRGMTIAIKNEVGNQIC